MTKKQPPPKVAPETPEDETSKHPLGHLMKGTPVMKILKDR